MNNVSIDKAVEMINHLEILPEDGQFQSMDMASIKQLQDDGMTVTLHSTEISDINGHSYIVTIDNHDETF